MQNKSLLYILVAVIFVVGLGVLLYPKIYSNGGDTVKPLVGDSLITKEEFGVPSNEKMAEEESSTVKNEGAYVDYTEDAFNQNKDKNRVLYFHADWCPICRPLDQAFQTRTNEIPTGYVIFKTNYDTETSLKTKYGITYQHTFVLVDEDGNEVKKWSGGDFDEVIEML